MTASPANFDIFTVDLPINLPEFVEISSFEYPIIKLQELIIDDLQFKLSQRTAPADKALKAKYQAILDEREEILLKRDRYAAACEHMRIERNRATDLYDTTKLLYDELTAANRQLVTENMELSRKLRHATDELAGVPKLVENKVALALSQGGASSKELAEAKQTIARLEDELDKLEQRRSSFAMKNTELSKQVNTLAGEVKDKQEHIKALAELTDSQQTQIKSTEIALFNADKNYHYVMHNIDELLAYASILSAENDEVRNESLYLNEAIQLHEMKHVWKKDGWIAWILCKPTTLISDEVTPDVEFGLMYVLNTKTGGGHTAYIDTEGDICFPITVDRSLILPDEYHDEFTEAAKAVPIAKIEDAILKGSKRCHRVIEAAKLLDIQWSSRIDLVEIAQRLSDYVPQHILERAISHLERSKSLTQCNANLIERINKRFNTEYTIKGRPVSPKKAEIGKPKRDRKKAKKKK